MTDQREPERPSQESVSAVPTFFVDGNVGTATAWGVARITLAAYKLNVDLDAAMPTLHPIVTIAVPEKSLLLFAHEIIERAEKLGVTIEDS